MPSSLLLCFLYQGGKILKLTPITSASFHQQMHTRLLNPLNEIASVYAILPNCWMKRNLSTFLSYLRYEREPENQRNDLDPCKT